MLEMLRAHGLDAGPTQRPLAAGAIAGLIADLPAIAVLFAFGSLDRLADAAGAAMPTTLLLHAAVMALGGCGYGLLFQRAANDPAGGWLFGMAYGYLLWQAVAVPLLQWIPGDPLLTGQPALGLLLGQLAWGLVLGAVFGWVHRPLRSGLEERTPAAARKGGWR
jgi:hypothetical protein